MLTSVEREATQLAPDQAALSVADRVARIFSLKATILAGANTPEGTQAGDRFAAEIAALVKESPTQDTRDVLDALLSTDDLDRFENSRGIPCRVAIVNGLLGLGFPYALEVSPTDLDLVRAHAGPRRSWVTPRSIRIVATVSMLWSLGLMGVVFKQLPNSAGLFFAAPFIIAFLHGMGALLTPSIPNRRTRQNLFSALAWMGLLGPASSVMAMLLSGSGLTFFLGLLVASPAMLTAWLARAEDQKMSDETL